MLVSKRLTSLVTVSASLGSTVMSTLRRLRLGDRCLISVHYSAWAEDGKADYWWRDDWWTGKGLVDTLAASAWVSRMIGLQRQQRTNKSCHFRLLCALLITRCVCNNQTMNVSACNFTDSRLTVSQQHHSTVEWFRQLSITPKSNYIFRPDALKHCIWVIVGVYDCL